MLPAMHEKVERAQAKLQKGRAVSDKDQTGHFFCCFFIKKAVFTTIFHNSRRAASDNRTLKRHEKWSGACKLERMFTFVNKSFAQIKRVITEETKVKPSAATNAVMIDTRHLNLATVIVGVQPPPFFGGGGLRKIAPS